MDVGVNQEERYAGIQANTLFAFEEMRFAPFSSSFSLSSLSFFLLARLALFSLVFHS